MSRWLPHCRQHDTPVLLLHGFGANSFALQRPAGPSLSRHLVGRGFEVWLLEFRGTSSSRPAAAAQGEICLDDKLRSDMPTALRLVQRQSGAPQVDIIGHSLGGTLLYAYLSHIGEHGVRRGVTIASPVRFHLPGAIRGLSELAATAAARLLPRRLPMRSFARLGVRTNIVYPARPHFNMRNIERSVLLAMMRDGIEDPSLAELEQLARWSREQRLLSWDGSTDFGTRLSQLSTPLLLIGGAADAHVPPRALEELSAQLGQTAQLLLIGTQTGACCDYGHTDLLLGPRAEAEVFTPLSRWLEAPG